MTAIIDVIFALVPLLLFILSVIFIYGVVGYSIFADITPYYGNTFLDQHANFQTILNSMTLLLAMMTGNVWTEITAAYENAYNQDVGWIIFINIYFISLYIIFVIYYRVIPIVIFYNYVRNSGSNIDVAGQQIRQFQKAWNLLKIGKRIKYIDLKSTSSLYELIKILPPPLGLCGENISRRQVSAFLKNILLSMPVHIKKNNTNIDINKEELVFKPSDFPETNRYVSVLYTLLF
jgi:hypothetical protein